MTTEIIIGYFATVFSMIAFLPTLHEIFKRGNANHISLRSTVLYLMSLTLWLTYGVLLETWPIVIQCTFSATIQMIILFIILKHVKIKW